MYINKNKHIVSSFLIIAAIVKCAMMVCVALGRAIFSRSGAEIVALNTKVERLELVTAVIQLVIISIVFLIYEKDIVHIKKVIPKEDFAEVALLQQEYSNNNISVLRLDQIDSLLKLWAFILVVMQIIYNFTTELYEQMIMNMQAIVLQSGMDGEIFIQLYNRSHGFKYICMMSAIMIGIFVSGLFLDDKTLIFTSIGMLCLFMITFMFISSSSMSMLGKNMEIVWSSILFHLFDTAGLLVSAIYIRIRYQGM